MWTEGGQIDHLTFAGMRGGGKGGSQQATSQQSGSTNTSGTSATQLPPWLTGAAQQAVGTAQTLSQNPNLFTPYQGQQVADISPLQQQALNYGGMTPQQTAGQIGSSAGDIYSAISGAATPGQQQNLYTGMNNSMSLLGPWLNAAPSAQQVAQNAQSMMSPYTQAVIDPTLALGQQALTQNLQQVGANANQAGAFGGSRQGVMEGVAQAQTSLGESSQVGNLLNTGYNTALGVAGNLGVQDTQNAYNAASLLGQQQMGVGNTLAGYGQTDINNALSAGQGLPQQYLGNLDTLGQQQQSQQQALLNAQMGNYYGAQQQPMQNLDVLLSALGGVPYGTSTSATGAGTSTGTGTTTQTTTPGLMNEITGGLGILGKGASLGGQLFGSGGTPGLLGALGG